LIEPVKYFELPSRIGGGLSPACQKDWRLLVEESGGEYQAHSQPNGRRAAMTRSGRQIHPPHALKSKRPHGRKIF
jgi:hypothetical protein